MDIDLFGKDPISALEKAAHNNPNRKFADFLGGYLSVLKVGGNVQSYLEAQLQGDFRLSGNQVKVRLRYDRNPCRESTLSRPLSPAFRYS